MAVRKADRLVEWRVARMAARSVARLAAWMAAHLAAELADLRVDPMVVPKADCWVAHSVAN